MHGPVCSSIDKRDTGTRVMHASVCTIGGRVAASGAGEGGTVFGTCLAIDPMCSLCSPGGCVAARRRACSLCSQYSGRKTERGKCVKKKEIEDGFYKIQI